MRSDENRLQMRVAELELLAERAEREVRRLRRHRRRSALLGRALTVGMVLLAAIALLAAAPDEPATEKTPFRVVDGSGNLIFQIDDNHRMQVYDKTGTKFQLSAGAPTGSKNAFFKAQWPDDKYSAGFGEVDGAPLMVMRDSGDIRVGLAVKSGRPVLELTNDAKALVFSLGQGENGGGRLVLMDAQGNTKVQAGTTASGQGAVATFPNGRGFSWVGLPGTFICGTGCGGK